MSDLTQTDSKVVRVEVDARSLPPAVANSPMKTFVESCLNTVAGSAVAVERRTRHRPRADKLLKALAGKRNILVTTHQHPDPDALASSHALAFLLNTKLKDASVSMSIKGKIGGGLNDAFTKHANLKLVPWDDGAIAGDKYDAILLLDTQPHFAYSPLPAGVQPTAVIDHHRTRGRNPKCPFCDIRTDVGATTSIIFSYFLELQVTIPADLAAAMLYAIETDLAGAAGQPGELDNIALSNLTLTADNHKLYQMRYVDLPQNFYVAMHTGVANAMFYQDAILSHLDSIDSLEKPAVIADTLLRFDQVQWSLVTAVFENRLVLSLRTSSAKMSAPEVMKRLVKKLGEGGGHRTKAGGVIPLQNATPAEIERLRTRLRRRYLRALGIDSSTRGQRLVPKADGAK
ncbi:MAG TPA: DHH family phosphoesterase [Tepidisphaeraceae bacterium]|jgi:nanoRNase/pAp phosphatase (c-di-AMP/oligoRNAs hydrolase)